MNLVNDSGCDNLEMLITAKTLARFGAMNPQNLQLTGTGQSTKRQYIMPQPEIIFINQQSRRINKYQKPTRFDVLLADIPEEESEVPTKQMIYRLPEQESNLYTMTQGKSLKIIALSIGAHRDL